MPHSCMPHRGLCMPTGAIQVEQWGTRVTSHFRLFERETAVAKPERDEDNVAMRFAQYL